MNSDQVIVAKDNLEENETNFENFIKLQQQQILFIKSNPDMSTLSTSMTFDVDELFQFLEEHFDTYHNSVNLKDLLPFIHLNLRRFVRLEHGKHDIGLVLYNFYNEHKESEGDISIVVQIIHQVLHSLNIYDNKEISVASKVFSQLAQKLPTINDRKLVSNIVACIQLYTNLYSQNKDILQTIWTDLCQRLKTDSVIRKTHIDILMHFFDAFSEIQPKLYCNLAVVATIQTLLKSSQRDERKCGYYLFKKIINCFMAGSQGVNNISFPAEYSHQIEQSWLSYITILENLEENQSHLILPSLRNLNELIAGKQLQSSWLDILFMRIITHKNNLVLRWSIEFFLNTFTCSELRLDILKLLLEALNSNILYNCEGYFVSKECLMSFFKGDLTNVYVLLGDINWKSIPLHMILSILHGNAAPKSLTHEQVLRIAPRVRALQDCRIRQATVAVANKLFAENVEIMSMSEYVIYVETLYNSTDKCNVFEQLYKKTQTFDEIIKQVTFKGRFYEILVANIDYTTPEEFTNFLKQIPVAKHGWLKLLPFHFNFEQGSQLLQFTELYGINFIEYITNNPLTKIFDDFDQHLCCDPDDKAECEQRRISAIAFYVHNLQSLDNVSDETFKILFNYKLTEKTIRKLCSCLSTTSTIFDNWIIDNLIELMATVRNEYEECHLLCSYLARNNLCDIFIAKMLDKCPRFVKKCESNILKHLNSPDFFCDGVKKGESRIEESYRVAFISPIETYLRDVWLDQVKTYGDEEYLKYLIDCHKQISKKKSRYFANSYEHRIKMRIALGFTNAIKDDNISDSILDDLWDILLNENNQLNLSYIYEYIIGTKDHRMNLILTRLKQAHTLTSSQQISIISAVYTFCMKQTEQLSTNDKESVIMNLMALTMGANFHTRLFAQIVLTILLSSKGFEGEATCATPLLQSIELATRGKLEEHSYDLRFSMHSFALPSTLWDVILYITNGPYDEMVNSLNVHNFSEELMDLLLKCKMEFSKKIDNTLEDVVEIEQVIGRQVQRKMNPSDVLEPDTLIIYPTKETNNEMFVIASLIDKLPNLGGIARTCEVLGIRNLVMNCKRDIEKNDFKNLSMTAEKTLNIVEVKTKDLREFIMHKQKEGFSVVGAEQTCNSENFVNFKFPEKCILLLGHEKDGIPPTLLGLLDHAVEIPQFGQVRSLNVHVTGALFMWEYCKQHLV